MNYEERLDATKSLRGDNATKQSMRFEINRTATKVQRLIPWIATLVSLARDDEV